MASVAAVCVSEKKGERKSPTGFIELKKAGGIVGDAHGDDIVRQVSLLADESAAKVRDALPDISPGDFAENILTKGIILYELPVGAMLEVGETLLEVTQIGKECHEGCRIKQITGDCVMPREGVFAKVVREGTVRPGDSVKAL
jgi:MOSC domain-containing protein YiiM